MKWCLAFLANRTTPRTFPLDRSTVAAWRWRGARRAPTQQLAEGSAIFVGVACLLRLVTLRQAGLGPDALVTGRALVAMYDRMFLVGQSFMPAVNALLLGSLLFQSRLVPRVLPVIGLIGAPLLLAADIAVLFGLIERTSSPALLTAIPIALWEFSLGIWLVVKGFRPSPILSSDLREAA